MRIVTIEELCDLLEAMTIEHSHDSGFAISHFGHIDGKPVSMINTCLGNGLSFIIRG